MRSKNTGNIIKMRIYIITVSSLYSYIIHGICTELVIYVTNTRTSERIGENICKLIIWLHKCCNNILWEYLLCNKMIVNLNVLIPLMKCRIWQNMKGFLIIAGWLAKATVHYRDWHCKVFQELSYGTYGKQDVKAYLRMSRCPLTKSYFKQISSSLWLLTNCFPRYLL